LADCGQKLCGHYKMAAEESSTVTSQLQPTKTATVDDRQGGVSKRLLDSYEKDVDGTSKAILAWVATLALIFTAIVNSLSPKLHDIQRIDAKRQGTIRAERRIISERESLHLGAAGENADLTNRVNEVAAANEERRKATTKQFVDLRRELGSVPTPLGAVTMPLRYLPMAWLALSTTLLLFVGMKRRHHLNQIAAMIRIQMAAGESPANLRLGGPLWCAPLPAQVHEGHDATPISRQDLAKAVGWLDQGESRSYVVIGTIATLAFVWLRMAQYAFALSRYDTDPLVQLKLRVLVAGLSLLALVLAAKWFILRGSESAHGVSTLGVSRRTWLRAIAVGAAGAGAYLVAPRWALPAFLRRDGRRIRVAARTAMPVAGPYRGKFLMHPKSRIVHYVDNAGWHSEQAELDVSAMIPVPRAVVLELIAGGAATPEVDAFIAKSAGSEPGPAASHSGGTLGSNNGRRRTSASPRRPRLLGSQLCGITECLALQMVLDGHKDDAFKLLASAVAANMFFFAVHARQRQTRLLDLALRIGSADQLQLARLREMRNRIALADRRGHARLSPPVTQTRPRTPWRTPYTRSRGFVGLLATDSIQV
jgi:hypothetical protein